MYAGTETLLIETLGLKKFFKTSRGNLHAVDNINLKIAKGHTLGVFGESGCRIAGCRPMAGAECTDEHIPLWEVKSGHFVDCCHV